MDTPRYSDEDFGILTEDNLYLDCVLVKPSNTADTDIRGIRVWVPRYPLAKNSVITCARQEVRAAGPNSQVAHLVFDLRGTGYSDGEPDNLDFAKDLHAIRLWAGERFGKISLSFLGHPRGKGSTQLIPIRPGVAIEATRYDPPQPSPQPPVLYLATYGQFTHIDDARCAALAQAGYTVFGIDPLRYLLHASVVKRLEAVDLWQDFDALCASLSAPPLLIGMPVSAGLALMWASGTERIVGVIAIGRAQLAFRPSHIFKNDNPHVYFLGRYVHKISPRPVAYIIQEGHKLGGDANETAALYQTSGGGHRKLKHVKDISPTFLQETLTWLQQITQP